MKNAFESIDQCVMSDVRTKYGIEYREAFYSCNGYSAKFPYFMSLGGLDRIVLDIINAYFLSGNSIKISFVYAEDGYLSMMINNCRAINYSVEYDALMPEGFVLKKCGIKMANIKRAAKKSGNGYVVLINTLRLAPNGIRVDMIDKRSEGRVTLKLNKAKKISQKT